MKSEFLKPLLRWLNSLLVYVSLLVFIGFQSCQVQDEFDEPNSKNLKNATIQEGNSITYWGHVTFTRSTGKPEVIKKKIGSSDLIHFEPGFVLHLKNGDGTNNLVYSAIIKLDGKQIFGPSDFSQNVTELSKEITGLTETSELEVEVRGVPNSFLEVWIEGTLLPGHALFSPDGGNFFFFDGTVQIILPPNAVKKPIYISIKNITEKLPPEYQTKISLAYEFLPDGLSFEKPLELSIKIKNDIEIKPYSQIGLFDIKSGYVFYNETNIDITNRVLSTEIEHFSTWAYWTWVNIPSFNENQNFKYYFEEDFLPTNFYGTPSDVKEAINGDIYRAFKRWEAYTSKDLRITFEQTYSNESSNVFISFHRNLFDFRYLPKGATAVVIQKVLSEKTGILLDDEDDWFSSDSFKDIKNSDFSPIKNPITRIVANNIEKTITHEIGHLFGLKDLNLSIPSMMTTGNYWKPITIHEIDISNLFANYEKTNTLEYGAAFNLIPLKSVDKACQGEILLDKFQVKVVDNNGRGIPYATVIYNAKTESGLNCGTLTNAVILTDENGIATLKKRELPQVEGNYILKAISYIALSNNVSEKICEFNINTNKCNSMLYIASQDLTVLKTPGVPGSHFKEIKEWETEYSIDFKSSLPSANTTITKDLLSNYKVLRLTNYYPHNYTLAEGQAIFDWVNAGGKLLADICYNADVNAVKLFGVDRIDGEQGGRY